MSSNGSITDFHIQALVDNELDWETEKRVRAHIENDNEARRRYEEIMHQKKLLQRWWQESKTTH